MMLSDVWRLSDVRQHHRLKGKGKKEKGVGISWQPPAYCLLLLLLYSRSVNKSCKYIVILVTVYAAVLSCSSIASLQSLWLLMVLCILDFETNITVDVCWHYSLHSVLPISAVNVTLCCLLSVVHVTWFELLMSTAFPSVLRFVAGDDLTGALHLF